MDVKLGKVWEAETTLSEQQAGQRNNKSKEPSKIKNLDRDLHWKNLEGASSELQMCSEKHLEDG